MTRFKKIIKRSIKYVLYGIPTNNITAQIVYTPPTEKLKGKKIIITGGGKGIGLAMAKRFIAEGAEVLITGRDEKTLIERSEELNCHYLKLDMEDINSFESFILKAETLLNGINCLVNNAGISLHEESYKDITTKGFDLQFNTNFRGGYFLTQKILNLYHKENRTGNILFISSETGETVDNRPYGWTKAAVNSMVQGLAFQEMPKGIRINAIAPGVTCSDMTGYKSNGNLYREKSIIKRAYLADEIAEVATFLVSDASGCISGQILLCNNGNTINARWK
ncbi:MAG: SDR family oxidoreductase [Clostridia bacterium]|nr:SDR family oxidoreductase [Clostridia bacterium]